MAQLALIEPISERALADRLASGRSSGVAFLACSEMVSDIPCVPQDPALPVHVWQSLGSYQIFGVTFESLLLANDISDVIVYGHYPCGLLKRVLESGTDSDQSLSSDSIQYFRELMDVKHLLDEENSFSRGQDVHMKVLAHHILQQLRNLISSPVIGKSIRERKIRLHGWLWIEQSAELQSFDPKSCMFIPMQ